jgi:hypothetical protein
MRRIVSGRPIGSFCLAMKASSAASCAGGVRTLMEIDPTRGLPRDFFVPVIDRMNILCQKIASRTRACTSLPGPNHANLQRRSAWLTISIPRICLDVPHSRAVLPALPA